MNKEDFLSLWEDLRAPLTIIFIGAIVLKIILIAFSYINLLYKYFSPKVVPFIDIRPDLSGAFIGATATVLLSALLSLLSFFFVRYLKILDSRREALREIEIHNTYSLQTAHDMQKKLLFFVERACKFVSDIKNTKEENAVIVSSINFNPLGQIHINPNGHTQATKSYYLHNKLLIQNSATQNVNQILTQFKSDFENLVRMNEYMISIATQRNDLKPKTMREAYAENVKAFADEVKRFADKEIPKGMESMHQIRVYNRKLRAPFGLSLFHRLKYEGFTFSRKDISLVDRIDEKIKTEVRESMKRIEKRIADLKSKEKID